MQIPKFVNIISMHWGFTLYNSLRIHRVNSRVAQFVWFKLYARIFGISAAYLKRDLHHLGRFPFVRTGRPDNCRTSQLANEIGFLQGFLLKKLCPSCILFGTGLSRLVVLIKSKIFVKTGTVRPFWQMESVLSCSKTENYLAAWNRLAGRNLWDRPLVSLGWVVKFSHLASFVGTIISL